MGNETLEEKMALIHESHGSIDVNTFEQILEMDDDPDDREFSRSLVFGFFDQARETFKDIESKITEKNLKELSSLGHFLKGSSATLGLTHVKDSCEKIQHYGSHEDEEGEKVGWEDSQLLSLIATTFGRLQVDFEDAERRLRRFYE